MSDRPRSRDNTREFTQRRIVAGRASARSAARATALQHRAHLAQRDRAFGRQRHARRGLEGVAVDDLEGQRDAAAALRGRRDVGQRAGAALPRQARPRSAGKARRMQVAPERRAARPARPRRVGQVSTMRSMSITGSAKPAATSMSPQSCMSVNSWLAGGQPKRCVQRAQFAQGVGPEAGEHQEAVGRHQRGASARSAPADRPPCAAPCWPTAGRRRLRAARRSCGCAPCQRRALHQGAASAWPVAGTSAASGSITKDAASR